RVVRLGVLCVSLLGMLDLSGCGCKRPGVVSEPVVPSLTYIPDPRVALPEDRLLDEIARQPLPKGPPERAASLTLLRSAKKTQALLGTAQNAEGLAGANQELCRVLGGSPDKPCLSAVVPLKRAATAPRPALAMPGAPTPEPPQEYLLCLTRKAGAPLGSLATELDFRQLVKGLREARADHERHGLQFPYRLNVAWEAAQHTLPPPPKPSADEEAAKAICHADYGWSMKQIDYDGALGRLADKRAREQRPPEDPGHGVRVAHLDTGYTDNCQYRDGASLHGPLQPQLGYDYFACGQDPRDPLTPPGLPGVPLLSETRQPSHGTGTGTVLASPHVVPAGCNPPQGEDKVLGIVPGAEVIPVRVTDGILLGFPSFPKALFEGIGDITFDLRVKSLAAGVYHAIDKHAQVISISMGGVCAESKEDLQSNAELQRVIAEAEQQGIIVVAAAGQYPMPSFLKNLFFKSYPVSFPGSYSSVITVAGSTVYGTPWSQSARGPKVDITAPALGVWRSETKREGDTISEDIDTGDGTSFATAITAGAAALWVQYWGHDLLFQRYGPALSSAFRYTLKKSAQSPAELAERLGAESYGPEIRRRVKPWNSYSGFGPGLLNVARLLSAPLPDRAEVCADELRSGRRGSGNSPAYLAVCPAT
ncbi:MAG TPA: S8/S53 family peptidase, partial [Vicinamibacteria bacterium]|nr:S8/S53 family peptidase [Vicinamibacteria bacterium]